MNIFYVIAMLQVMVLIDLSECGEMKLQSLLILSSLVLSWSTSTEEIFKPLEVRNGIVVTLLVGPHKTGTTTTQGILVQNSKLLAQDGILHCNNFVSSRSRSSQIKSTAILADELQQNVFNSTNTDILRNCLSQKKYDHVILSSELFDVLAMSAHSSGLKFLASAAPRIRAVVTERPRGELLRSQFHQSRGGFELKFGLRFNTTQKLFGQFISMHIEALRNGRCSEKDSYNIVKTYQQAGIPTFRQEFLDMKFLFCSVIRSPAVCRELVKGFPHLNSKAMNLTEECISRGDAELLQSLGPNCHIPLDEDYSSLICDTAGSYGNKNHPTMNLLLG